MTDERLRDAAESVILGYHISSFKLGAAFEERIRELRAAIDAAEEQQPDRLKVGTFADGTDAYMGDRGYDPENLDTHYRVLNEFTVICVFEAECNPKYMFSSTAFEPQFLYPTRAAAEKAGGG